MKKLLLAGFLFSLMFTGCDKKQVKTFGFSDTQPTADSLSQNSGKLPNISGTYKGTISCDDCESVELTLKEKNIYFLKLQLSSEIQTADNTVISNGVYFWNQDHTIISLDKYDFRFKIGNKKLYYLDHESNIDENEVLVKQ